MHLWIIYRLINLLTNYIKNFIQFIKRLIIMDDHLCLSLFTFKKQYMLLFHL